MIIENGCKSCGRLFRVTSEDGNTTQKRCTRCESEIEHVYNVAGQHYYFGHVLLSI